MQIKNITNLDGQKLVEIVEYPHAQPVVPNNLTNESEILAYLAQPLWDNMSWEQCQQELDQINNNTASQEVINRHQSPPPDLTIVDVTSIIKNGDERIAEVNTSVMAENFYTKSKVIDVEKDYSKDFTIEKLSNKKTHPSITIVKGKKVLNLEARIVALEALVANLIKKK